ncbi:MAG: HEPN domain-containing protein [Deltaproteobacteria bacterium]|nr:HEPN domain-containing protein [Deltaproteobacteria bacterium]
MTENESGQSERRSILVAYWMEKAHESLAAGRSEYNSGRLTTAVRDLYYAAFYALTSFLLKEGRSFKKHTGVKAALHRDLIKEGILEPEWGRFYNKIFDSRHEGDYQPLRVFQAEEVKLYLEQCGGFIAWMEALLKK